MTWSWQSKTPGITHRSEQSIATAPAADSFSPTPTTRPSATCTSSGPPKPPDSSRTFASAQDERVHRLHAPSLDWLAGRTYSLVCRCSLSSASAAVGVAPLDRVHDRLVLGDDLAEVARVAHRAQPQDAHESAELAEEADEDRQAGALGDR